jgi:hypothetical protein
MTPFERADLEHEIALQAIVWHGHNRDRRQGMDRTTAALYDTVQDLLNALDAGYVQQLKDVGYVPGDPA